MYSQISVTNKYVSTMDVKIVLVFILIIFNFIHYNNARKNLVVFNFREKLKSATTTTTETTQNGQIIRVPDLECGNGYRRDRVGICRMKF